MKPSTLINKVTVTTTFVTSQQETKAVLWLLTFLPQGNGFSAFMGYTVPFSTIQIIQFILKCTIKKDDSALRDSKFSKDSKNFMYLNVLNHQLEQSLI